MFWFFNLLLGLMAAANLLGLALGKYPTMREIAGRLQATDDGPDQLKMSLVMAALVQIYLIGLVFPLKALHHTIGLIWAVLMVISVLETVFTARKMKAVVTGEDTTGQFPLHDSPGYLAYQIAYNMAILGAVAVLMAGPRLIP
ncbi:MAG: hypothetical protein ACK46X_13385 [Candidatus Sericytochromatia bacterium]